MRKLPGVYIKIRGKRYRYTNPPSQDKVFTLTLSDDNNGNVVLLTSGFTLNSAHDGNGNATLIASDGCTLRIVLQDGNVTLGVK